MHVKSNPGHVQDTKEDELLTDLMDSEYTQRPFYGSRKMVVYSCACGHVVNRKCV